MTNTAKKPAKKSDTQDLDLDARLDSATATLYLDDEPVEGDMLDQVLAKAKKELDAVLPEPDDIDLDAVLDLPVIDDLELDEVEKTIPLQSESLKTLESQLAAAMETSSVSDDELDNLLGSSGFDFDSLLGEADDEIVAAETEITEESLLAAVDELLNFGVEEIVEPEILEPIESNNDVVEFDIDLDDDNDEALIEPKVEAVVEPEVVEIEPEVEAIVEPEAVEIEPEVEAIVEPEVVEIEPEVEAIVEPEVVEIEPEVEAIVEPEVVEIESEVEAIVEPEVVEIESEVEAIVEPEVVEIEAIVEDEVEYTELNLGFEFESEGFLEPEVADVPNDKIENPEAELTELNDLSEIELTVEPNAALDDLVDSVPFDEVLTTKKEDDADEFFVEEFNDFDNVADIAAPLVEISLPADDELDVAQQLDGLNDAMENKIDDTAAGFDLLDDADKKAQATPAAQDAEDDLDWMKQLDDLDATETKDTPAESETVAEEDDWMKQLDDLDATETKDVSAESETVAEEDDWMKQLDDLDEVETEAVAEDEDDWMKQLESIDDSNDTAIDDDFNIADETAQKIAATSAPVIDEESLIAKAAEIALGQFKEEQDAALGSIKEKQDLTFSQLRADQDTLEAKNRKQFADAENGQKKAATFGFAALGVGIIGLLGSGGLGYLSMGTKTQTETLQQSVAELQETVNDIVSKTPEKEKEIAGIKTSVEQLSQKVEKLVAAQVTPVEPVVATEAGQVGEVKTGEPAKSAVNLTNGKTPAESGKVAPLTTGKVDTGLDDHKLTEPEIAPPVDITPEHPAGEKVAPKLADMAKKTADDAKAKADKIAKEKADQAKAKEEAALLTEKLAKISTIAKAAAASTKTEEPRASRNIGKMTRGMARGFAKEKAENLAASKTGAKKEILKADIKQPKAAPAGKYAVNVVSYQQEWFAQSKAAEFKAKGIPVEVSPVDASKIGTKYRLKVGGFKSRQEASAYAKSKGLGDAWVSN